MGRVEPEWAGMVVAGEFGEQGGSKRRYVGWDFYPTVGAADVVGFARPLFYDAGLCRGMFLSHRVLKTRWRGGTPAYPCLRLPAIWSSINGTGMIANTAPNKIGPDSPCKA